MRLFRKNRPNVEANFKAITEIQSALAKRYCRPDGSGPHFIHPGDAGKVLRRERIRDLLGHFRWYEEDDRDQVWRSMSLIICILVVTGWQDWYHFKDYFYEGNNLKNPKLVDVDLPLVDEAEPFLPPTLWADFLRDQYIFTPIFINENRHDQIYSDKVRLPILRKSLLDEERAQGAQGVVEKVEIDGRFIAWAGGRINPNIQLVALKRIAAKRKQDFKAETQALMKFTVCLLQHRNIMKSITSFVHGSDFVILFPWAEGRDLHQFFYNPDKVFPNFPELSRRFSPNNLLTEAYNLTQALHFLHNQMTTDRGGKLRCAHLDLKPENILVCFPADRDPESCPVGEWKITDFGMAKVEESVVRREIVPEQQAPALAPGNVLRELSIQPPRRGAGAFQPPEVQTRDTAKVSTRRDVWSFGCILAMVLAFALGGPEEIAKQQRLRAKGTDDYFYRRRRQQGAEQSISTPSPSKIEAEIKPNIRNWLLHDAPALSNETHSEWIRACSALIISLLNVDVVKRPEINVAMNDLGKILTHTNVCARQRMWDFGDASSVTETVTTAIPQLAVRRSSTDSDAEFLGLPSNSPPSSAPSPQRAVASSASFSSFFKPDESVSFLRFEPPQKGDKASIESSAETVVLYSPSEVFIYSLSQINDESAVWAGKPSKSLPFAEQSSSANFQAITSSVLKVIEKVVLHGSFIGVLERQSDNWSVQIFVRKGGKYKFGRSIRLVQKPEYVKLSSMGRFAVKYTTHIDLYIPGADAPVLIKLTGKQILGLAFSEDGAYLCLWERDRGSQIVKGDLFHYWTVWDADERVLGETISHVIEPYNYKTRASKPYLIPFHKYPRFIACDLQYNIYLVSADADSKRVVHLGHSANVWTGLALPDDDGFVLIRASQHGRQKAERFALTSLSGVPSWKPYACGDLYADIDKRHHGYAMRNYKNTPGVPAWLSLTPDGLLTRKVL